MTFWGIFRLEIGYKFDIDRKCSFLSLYGSFKKEMLLGAFMHFLIGIFLMRQNFADLQSIFK